MSAQLSARVKDMPAKQIEISEDKFESVYEIHIMNANSGYGNRKKNGKLKLRFFNKILDQLKMKTLKKRMPFNAIEVEIVNSCKTEQVKGQIV